MVKKDSNIVRLVDGLIGGQNNRSIRLCYEIINENGSNGYPRRDLIRLSGSIRIFLGKIYAENVIIGSSDCFISRV